MFVELASSEILTGQSGEGEEKKEKKETKKGRKRTASALKAPVEVLKSAAEAVLETARDAAAQIGHLSTYVPTIERNAQRVEQVETCLHLILPLVCQIHHMLGQKNLKENYEDSEDSLRRRHEFLWRVEKHRKQQEEEEKAREAKANREKEQQKRQEMKAESEVTEAKNETLKRAVNREQQIRKTETEVVEEKTIDEVEEQIIATSANRSDSSEVDGLSKPPGLILPTLESGYDMIRKRERNGASLYGAIKRKLTPTPAKFRIHSDPETDNSLTLNSDASAPSHWWHESTSPNARSRSSDKFDEDRLSPNEMAAPDQREDEVSEADKSIAFTLDLSADDRNFHVKDEISGIAPEDRNLQCPDQSILNRFLQDTEMPVWVLSPCSKRIRPNSGLLEIQTDYSIEMEQPTRWGMGTE